MLGESAPARGTGRGALWAVVIGLGLALIVASYLVFWRSTPTPPSRGTLIQHLPFAAPAASRACAYIQVSVADYRAESPQGR